MKKEFIKSDLKDGMVVEYATGERRLIFKDVLTGLGAFNKLCYYNEDLTIANKDCPHLNIEKVYIMHKIRALEDLLEDDNLSLIWERTPLKRMTVKEIEKELGYKIEIIEE